MNEEGGARDDHHRWRHWGELKQILKMSDFDILSEISEYRTTGGHLQLQLIRIYYEPQWEMERALEMNT